MMKPPKYLGNQYIIELYQCDEDSLDNINFLEKVMKKAAHAAGATIVQQFFHQFSPQGISGTIVIAESHLNIHTWPEYNFAAVDIFTCGENLDPDAAMLVLKKELNARHSKIDKIKRGKDIAQWTTKPLTNR